MSLVKFYCVACDKHQDVIIEPMETDNLNGDIIWGDVICSVCRLVIATITADKVGIYEFVKVGDIVK